MNSYVDQYDEMKLFFDKIRKEVEIKPHDEVELRTIMSNLNQFGVKNAGEKIEYPMLNRRDIFQDMKDQTCYLSKGGFFPPYIELSTVTSKVLTLALPITIPRLPPPYT